MHGRQKVVQSEEEDARKQKERCKKVAAYQHAMKLIFEKRFKGELDEDMLMITGQVLALNPDISTLWNIRKTTLLEFMASDLTIFKEKTVPKELDFNEFCLKTNPKSYGSWHHRQWIMKQTNFELVAEELKLCAKYLEYDDRNFHCWDYRRYLLDNSSLVTVEQEIDFTTEKISSNFSNFSSWHLRSKLLPRLSTDYLNTELELIRNAVFTDPKDQSSWLYHSWLLKTQIPSELPKAVFLFRKNSDLILVFNVKVSNPSLLGIIAFCGEIFLSSWNNPWLMSKSKLWLLNVLDAGNNDIHLSGEIFKKEFKSDNVIAPPECLYNHFPPYFDEESKPKSPSFESLLREELTWVMELHELEPDIKWPVVTAITLMRLINFKEFEIQVMEMVEKLIKLDPKRTNYYFDFRSKIVMEFELLKLSSSLEAISFKGLNLTALYYPERLCHIKTLKFSENNLKVCASLGAFQMCEELDLSNNCVELNSYIEKYVSPLKQLKILRLDGNPICETPYFDKLVKSLNNIKFTF